MVVPKAKGHPETKVYRQGPQRVLPRTYYHYKHKIHHRLDKLPQLWYNKTRTYVLQTLFGSVSHPPSGKGTYGSHPPPAQHRPQACHLCPACNRGNRGNLGILGILGILALPASLSMGCILHPTQTSFPARKPCTGAWRPTDGRRRLTFDARRLTFNAGRDILA